MVFLLIGVVAGVLAGLFGIGGGILIVPALMLVAGFAPQTATGTSLAALVLPIGLLGALSYHRAGHVRIAAALLISAGAFCGTYLGAALAQHLSPAMLRRGFAVLLILVGCRLWWGK